jgi:hypothetical protein
MSWAVFGSSTKPGIASAVLAESDVYECHPAPALPSGGGNRCDRYGSATEDIRGWATRQRLFQLRGEEGQRSKHRPVVIALHQSQLWRNCQAADIRSSQHELCGRSKDPTFEKVVLCLRPEGAAAESVNTQPSVGRAAPTTDR